MASQKCEKKNTSRKMPPSFYSRVELSGKVPVTHSIPSIFYGTVTTSSLRMEQQPRVVGWTLCCYWKQIQLPQSLFPLPWHLHVMVHCRDFIWVKDLLDAVLDSAMDLWHILLHFYLTESIMILELWVFITCSMEMLSFKPKRCLRC